MSDPSHLGIYKNVMYMYIVHINVHVHDMYMYVELFTIELLRFECTYMYTTILVWRGERERPH